MAREESGARWTESEGNEGWRRAVAGFNISKNNTLRPMLPVRLTHLTPER